MALPASPRPENPVVRTAKPIPLMMMTSIEFDGWVVLAVSLGLCIVSEVDVGVVGSNNVATSPGIPLPL